MKFSFKRQDMSNWKGRIAESLISFFIRDVLIPRLKKEGWDNVIFFPFLPHVKKLYKPLEEFPPYLRSYYKDQYKEFKRILLTQGLFPDEDLSNKFNSLSELLKVVPDGFLLKLRKTGKTITAKDIVSDIGVGSRKWSSGETQYEFSTENIDETSEIPIVTGEIEIIEVKSGEGRLHPTQKESYESALEKGFPLRLFHVELVSFDRNHFEVEEKLQTRAH